MNAESATSADPMAHVGPNPGGYGHLALSLVLRAVGVSLGSAGLLIAAAWTFLGR